MSEVLLLLMMKMNWQNKSTISYIRNEEWYFVSFRRFFLLRKFVGSKEIISTAGTDNENRPYKGIIWIFCEFACLV